MSENIKYVQLPAIGGYYFLGSDGIIYRIRELRNTVNRSGYEIVQLFDETGKKYYSTMHALVASCFIGPRPDGMVINHKDGNKINNCVENLEYCTPSENVKHAWASGLCKPNTALLRQNAAKFFKGKPGSLRKFTDDEVREIIRLYRTGEFSMKELGKRNKCSASSIHRMIHGNIVYKYVVRDHLSP